ncbi:hypothetical protein F5888DRAFT_700290 [Russula emetica]|nr:hypothetical protein F5888DRAFT_700290 [Russula emetica]
MTYAAPITSLPALTTSFFYPPLFRTLGGQHPTDISRYHAAAVRSRFHLVLVFPLYTYTSSQSPPRGRLYYTKSRLSRQVVCMYSRQPRSSRRASFSIKQFSLPISFPFLLTCVLFRLGDHLVEPLSPRSRLISGISPYCISVDFSFLSLISLSPFSVEKWEKNQKVFAASDARAGPVIGCPGRSQQPRLEIGQDHQMYSLRGHGRAHGNLHPF